MVLLLRDDSFFKGRFKSSVSSPLSLLYKDLKWDREEVQLHTMFCPKSSGFSVERNYGHEGETTPVQLLDSCHKANGC